MVAAATTTTTTTTTSVAASLLTRPLRVVDLAVPAACVLAMAAQAGSLTYRVGAVRRRVRVAPPVVDAPPELARAVRAQANTHEHLFVAAACVVPASLWLHELAPLPPTLVFVVARHAYFTAYVANARARILPYQCSQAALLTLGALATLGVVRACAHRVTGVDVFAR